MPGPLQAVEVALARLTAGSGYQPGGVAGVVMGPEFPSIFSTVCQGFWGLGSTRLGSPPALPPNDGPSGGFMSRRESLHRSGFQK